MIKKCLKCGIEKELNNKNFIYRKNGDYWENTCRECNNRIRRLKYNNGIDTRIKNSKVVKTENKSNFDYCGMDEKQKEKLFILIDNYDKIIKMINYSIDDSKKDTGFKIKKSITISEDLHNNILNLTRNSNTTYSNVVDVLLRKALKDI
jgi:hypothetical protein